MKYPDRVNEWTAGPAPDPDAYCAGEGRPDVRRCREVECPKLVFEKYSREWMCVAAGVNVEGLLHCPLGKFTDGDKLDDITYLDGVNRFETGELVVGYGLGQVHNIEWSYDKDIYCRAIINCIPEREISDEEVSVIDAWLREESRKNTIKNAISDMRHQVSTEEIKKELERREREGV